MTGRMTKDPANTIAININSTEQQYLMCGKGGRYGLPFFGESTMPLLEKK